MTQNEAQNGRRQVKKNTRLRILSLTAMLCVFGAFVLGKIALHIEVHPQPSLATILIQDVFSSLSLLVTFGFAVLAFNQTFADDPNESWIERFKKRPDNN